MRDVTHIVERLVLLVCAVALIAAWVTQPPIFRAGPPATKAPSFLEPLREYLQDRLESH